MKLNSRKIFIILLLFICASLFITNFASARYKIETTIPTPGFNLLPKDASPDLATYIRGIYLFGIGLVGVAALVYLTIGGLIYMTSDTIGSKEKAKEYIWGAISGLILALAAYLILYTINPNLVKLKKPELPKPSTNIEQIKYF
ncbi:MAG: hypothetical protein CMI55_02830 [Parcubacteria group bacterium]|nr:hypothetical protein [Parcubacteria group bacterium]|tara:strand:+ start:301 stop:732 length:432 start_codon:yes stop_codon:yes gene_type:complete